MRLAPDPVRRANDNVPRRTGVRGFLERLGAGSPLVPALGYAVAAIVANLVATVAPDQPLLLVLALLLWAVAGLMFFVVVTWFRSDDWLAAGFLISLTLLLGAWVGNLVADVIVQRSVAPAILAAPAMFLGVVVRGAIGIPVFGGLVALLRGLTPKPPPPRT